MNRINGMAIMVAGALALGACGGGGGGGGAGDVTEGLVAEWACDGDVTDSVGSADGVASGGLTYVADRHGAAGSACDFNGTDAKVSVTGSIGDGEPRFSVAYWAKTTDAAFTGEIIGGAGSGGNLFNINRATRFTMIRGTTKTVTATTPTDGTWTQIVTTYEDSTQVMRIYVNGELAAETIKGSFIGNLLLTSIQIGQFTSADYYEGSLDDIRLYNRELSADEVKELYDYQI